MHLSNAPFLRQLDGGSTAIILHGLPYPWMFCLLLQSIRGMWEVSFSPWGFYLFEHPTSYMIKQIPKSTPKKYKNM